MKRQIRWSLLMAVLGFILGLGWLLPLPSYESRFPASVKAETLALAPGADSESMEAPIDPSDGKSGSDEDAWLDIPEMPPKRDYRADVLFDVHTISRGTMTKNTDAYVGILYANRGKKDEIQWIYYCHNYDFNNQKANPKLHRYEVFDKKKRFNCQALSLSGLTDGIPIITAGALGNVLTLVTTDFDTKKGGIISGIFAHKLAKFRKNIYRRIDMKITLGPRGATITGPGGESFDWMNLKMSEDIFNIPTGVEEFEFLQKGEGVKKYPSDAFPRE